MPLALIMDIADRIINDDSDEAKQGQQAAEQQSRGSDSSSRSSQSQGSQSRTSSSSDISSIAATPTGINPAAQASLNELFAPRAETGDSPFALLLNNSAAPPPELTALPAAEQQTTSQSTQSEQTAAVTDDQHIREIVQQQLQAGAALEMQRQALAEYETSLIQALEENDALLAIEQAHQARVAQSMENDNLIRILQGGGARTNV